MCLYAQDSDSGEREPVVWKLGFEGNETYSSMVLKEIIATDNPGFIEKILGKHGAYVLSENELRRDQIRIRRYYERRGFIQVQVDYEVSSLKRDWRKRVTFRITEGSPLMIRNSRIVIDADSTIAEEIRAARDFERAEQRHDFREGMRYQSLRTADTEGLFLLMLENQGFAWPEVDIETAIDSVANRADVTITARPNQKTYFSEIRIEQNLSVPDRVLLRETDIREGEVYSRDKMQEGQRQIFNHHLFRFATINLPEQPRDSTLEVLFRVREHPLRSVQATIGFGREEYLRGQLEWRHRNITGRGHRFGINGRGSFIEQRLTTGFLFPYVFNPKSSNVATVFGVHKLEPSFELFQAGFNNSLIYELRRSVTASATYEFSINEELSRDPDVSLPDTVLNYNVSSLTISGYYSEGLTRDPRGWVIQPFLESSGLFGEGTFSFQKLSLDVRRYTRLSRSTTLATRISTGKIFYSGQRTLPSNILFFTGGTNSVRGWNRQRLGPARPAFRDDGSFREYVPTGGRAQMIFNIEVRQQLSGFLPKVGIAAFLDGGQIWADATSLDERPIQFGTGGGIRYQSPIGPIRVDIGYKLNPTDEDLNIYEGTDFGSRWSRIGIHFSIGQAF
ncbi:BamA/OMP85 family outer membrane protein [Rhodohalobacter mucosus]|nr:BamA/TamA family outer membrane protein [Rhodohalobacter mucosus]